MRVEYIVLVAPLIVATSAHAGVEAETECYVRVPAGNDSKMARLIFRRYFDVELKKEVGSFVQYNGTKEIIPLVFSERVSTDPDSPELGNYEDYRTEIVGKKVTGEYLFGQTGAGIRQGKYVRYTSAKSRKSVVFQLTVEDNGCKVNH